MRADQDWCIPVITLRWVALGGLWSYIDTFTGASVIARQVALLPLRVNDVRIGRIDGGLVPIAKQSDKPVCIGDAVYAHGTRWAAFAVIVLGAAIDVVKRLFVVHRNLVELGNR